MTAAVQGGLLGAAFAAGVWLVLAGMPWRRVPDLVERLEPFLRDVVPTSRPVGPARRTALERLLAPVMSDAVRWVERLSGGPGTVRRRLDQAGGARTVEEFRVEQVVWGVGGLAAGVVLAGLTAVARGPAPVPMAALVVVSTLVGVLLPDQLLTWQVRRREERMMQEFPTIAELLALAVGAGEGAVAALERVASTCSGELSYELRRTLADARAGASLVAALEGLAARTSLPPLIRFVDGVAVAVDRGTPLADVLRAQAQDARDAGRRRLMEEGGRKEIAMMVPVVFLVLPVTVLFAIYPGLVALRLDY